MKYQVIWLENKEKLKEVKLKDMYSSEEHDAVIWKTDKDGKTFPGYEEIINGGEVEGNLWTSPSNGKKTLYPITPKKTGGSGANVAKAMETKRENIAEAQGRKETAIEMAATARDATLLTVEWVRNEAIQSRYPLTTEIQSKWLEWRKWLTGQFGNPGAPFQ